MHAKTNVIWFVLPLAGTAACSSNFGVTGPTVEAGSPEVSDTPPPVFCEQSDGRRIQAGAAFTGCGCCVCTASAGTQCYAFSCADASQQQSPGNCQSDQDCAVTGGSFCVFDPGCDSPHGTCMVGPGACPFGTTSPSQYCGCDGVTYSVVDSSDPWSMRQFPYKPYLHYGACP